MNFPQELAALPQWVCWRMEPRKDDQMGKVPYNPKSGKKASSTNPATWASLDAALAAKEQYMFSGLGFVFTAAAGIVGIDIDHCIENGELNDTANAILGKVPPTYVEISPSGTGLHLFLRGALPEGGRRNAKSQVEMYASERYFTMTGQRFSGAPMEIAADNGALAWIHETYIKQAKAKKSRKKKSAEPLSDEELLEKARASSGGAAFGKLWDGQWQGDFGSQSEADLALCCKLAFWSGKNREQMDRLFRQSGLMREKWDERHHASGATYGEETIDRAIDRTEDIYGKDDAPVFCYEGCYWRRKGENIYPLTNFIVQPIEMIVSDDDTAMTADLLTTRGEIFRQTFMTSDFATLPRFKNLLNKRTISLCYLGGEGDLELLKRFVSELDWVRKTGVKALGLYVLEGRWVFATTEGAIEKGSKAVGNVVQLEKYQSIKSSLARQQVISAEQLQALGKWLLSYNEPAKTVSVLAWCAGCFIKPHLRKASVKFPHLFLIGEAGSGKSNTLERVILPMFSRTKVTAATQVTPFTLMRDSASSNMVPQPLDEFKPSKMDRQRLCALYNQFRDAYDGHEGQRGRADQTTVSYELLAPMVVAGEESPDESAIRERGIELLFSRKDLKPAERKAAFAALCARSDSLAAFGRGLLEVALRTSVSEVQHWHSEALEHFDKALPSRVVNNLACCAAGLRLCEKLCSALGLNFLDIFEISLNSCFDYLAFAAREYLLDGGPNNVSIVEQTFEVLARMSLDPQSEYSLNPDGTVLSLWLNHVYDRYTKYRKDYAVLGEALTYAQFKKQLEHSDYFLAKNVQQWIGGQNRKVWQVNFALLSERCDVAGLENTMEPLGS